MSKTVSRELDGNNSRIKGQLKSEMKEATKACIHAASELP